MLDMASEDGIDLTNLALQKLLYFAHGLFRIRIGVPLVSGFFEAWTYGPVHPTVYHAFKAEEDRPISIRAVARDVMSGQEFSIDTIRNQEIRRHIREILSSYGKLSPGRLVEISHAPNGPWAFVVNKAKTSVAFGLRISDDVTLGRTEFFSLQISRFFPWRDITWLSAG
jgi:uncharacterized phage-associated protein